jgi:hypothetical protein
LLQHIRCKAKQTAQIRVYKLYHPLLLRTGGTILGLERKSREIYCSAREVLLISWWRRFWWKVPSTAVIVFRKCIQQAGRLLCLTGILAYFFTSTKLTHVNRWWVFGRKSLKSPKFFCAIPFMSYDLFQVYKVGNCPFWIGFLSPFLRVKFRDTWIPFCSHDFPHKSPLLTSVHSGMPQHVCGFKNSTGYFWFWSAYRTLDVNYRFADCFCREHTNSKHL